MAFKLDIFVEFGLKLKQKGGWVKHWPRPTSII